MDFRAACSSLNVQIASKSVKQFGRQSLSKKSENDTKFETQKWMSSVIQIDLIVTASVSADFNVFVRSLKQLNRYYPLAKKVIIVPCKDISLFKNSTLKPNETVVSEEDVLSQEVINSIRAVTGSRSGWYIQQLAKLALLFGSVKDFDVAMIWDSDTVQVRAIKHLDDQQRVRFAATSEFNKPYFDQIYRLLGLSRVVNHSFIAQYIVVRKKWVESLWKELGGNSWVDRILQTIDFSEVSGFSEYELIGTYVSHRFKHEFAFNKKVQLLRGGNSRLGGIQRFYRWETCIFRIKYHLIAYEKSDPVQTYFDRIHRAIVSRLG